MYTFTRILFHYVLIIPLRAFDVDALVDVLFIILHLLENGKSLLQFSIIIL